MSTFNLITIAAVGTMIMIAANAYLRIFGSIVVM